MRTLAVGLMEGREVVEVELIGKWHELPAGRHRLVGPITLKPRDPLASFAIDDITIGIGFHWERRERQEFRGGLRVIREASGLTVINDVELEDYVTSVISSEMSAACPLELLKAHALISRSWMWYPKANPQQRGPGTEWIRKPREIIRWYGRESHEQFDVCADDHCQRYQGITKVFSPEAARAVSETAGEMLTFGGEVCDARFSKCCGGRSEDYSVAWDDKPVPYLVPVTDPWCDTHDRELLRKILPSFDQETRDFFRWRVEYEPEELGGIVKGRLGMDLGPIRDLEPLGRGASGRIYRLRIVGSAGEIIVGKELEIRRALSRSHLYSSAFDVVHKGGKIVLNGMGWGHGVGLCQIGAAVMASNGKGYKEILSFYYPATECTDYTA